MALAFALSRVPPVPSVIGGAFNACRTIFTRPQMPIHPSQGTVSAPVFGVCGSTAGAGGPWTGSLLSPWLGLIGAVSGRTNIRNHFPRPSEVKRIKRHGWKARMATLAGRRTLMRRILKGRHVYSH